MKLEEVLAMYKEAGHDIEDEDCEVPNVLPGEGGQWFFTGDLILTDGKYHKIVIVAEWFEWSDVQSDLDD